MKNTPELPEDESDGPAGAQSENRSARNGHLLPAADAFARGSDNANELPAEEQMARFLLWLKIHDGGHQPC
jgi:hypothetical protein